MARFTVFRTIPSGQTQALGLAVAEAHNTFSPQSVETVIRNNAYEVRVWDDMREDGSNRSRASPNVDYG